MIKTTPIDGDPIAYAKRQLGPEGPGFVAIHSKILDAMVLFVRDDAAMIPNGLQRIPRYYFHELKALAKDPPDPEGLRRVHQVRETFNGRVIDPDKADRPLPPYRPRSPAPAPTPEPEITPEEPEKPDLSQLSFL